MSVARASSWSAPIGLAQQRVCIVQIDVTGGEVFAELMSGLFDGFRVDRHGRIWASADEGVHCYDPDGTLIGKILIPEIVANVTFGGASAIGCSSAARRRSIRSC